MIVGPQTLGETLEDCQVDELLRSKNNISSPAQIYVKLHF